MGKGFSKKKKDKLTITTEVPEGASGSGSKTEAGQSSAIASKCEQKFLTANESVLSDAKRADIDVMQEVLQEAKQMEAARAVPDDGYTTD